MTPRITAAIAAIGIVFGASTVPALAADETAAQKQAQAGSYSEEKLQSFALAALDIQQIQQEVRQRMAQMDDQAMRQQIADEAQTRMYQAVETVPGISVDEYIEIAEAAQEDPALAERVSRYMEPGQPTQQ